MRRLATTIIREPLVLFLILGAAIFALDRLRPRLDAPEIIDVSERDLERMRSLWEAEAGRLPTEVELEVLVEERIREEVLYREALRLGLDRDDVIIRRRLAQKIAFLLEDGEPLAEPDETALLRFFETHRRKYERPARISFEHIYFSPDRRDDAAVTDATETLRELQANGAREGSERGLGDPFLLPSDYEEQTREDISSLFGDDFANAVDGLASNRWHGPIRSAYGVHLVRLREHRPAVEPEFAKIRDRVLEDYRAERRRDVNRKQYENLRGRYEVGIAERIRIQELARRERSAQ